MKVLAAHLSQSFYYLTGIDVIIEMKSEKFDIYFYSESCFMWPQIMLSITYCNQVNLAQSDYVKHYVLWQKCYTDTVINVLICLM